MHPAQAALAALAGIFWLSAAGHFVAALGHLSGRTSVGGMLLRGLEAFNAENFTERGQALQRRMMYSALGFVLCIPLVIVAGAVVGRAP